MDDLISRQTAIEEISKQQTYKMFEGEDTLYLDANDVGSVLASLPSAQPEPKWIPCSERLPEEGQEILATTTDNAWGDVVIIRTYYKEMHKSVIAWMPLPEPYAERRTDD